MSDGGYADLLSELKDRITRERIRVVLSARNLKYMWQFAAVRPERAIVQEVLAQLPSSTLIPGKRGMAPSPSSVPR